MSNFGAKLAELIERNHISAADLADLTQISDSLISKWVNGKQTFVDPVDLAKLCANVTKEAKEQAELIRAHLLDEFQDCRGSELIDVRILSGAEKRALRLDQPPYGVPLPPNLQRAFDIVIPESVTDADVRDMVLGIAAILSRSESVVEGDSSSPGHRAAEDVVAAAVGDVKSQSEPKAPRPPAGPARHKVPKRSKS